MRNYIRTPILQALAPVPVKKSLVPAPDSTGMVVSVPVGKFGSGRVLTRI